MQTKWKTVFNGKKKKSVNIELKNVLFFGIFHISEELKQYSYAGEYTLSVWFKQRVVVACQKDTRVVTVRLFFGYYCLFYMLFPKEKMTMRKYIEGLCLLF